MSQPRHSKRRIPLGGGLLAAVIVAVALGVLSGGGGGGGGGPTGGSRGTGGPGDPVAVDPSRFARGACIAYPPTHGDRGRTVFLDAGHGGVDPGSVGQTESGKTIYEADETLPVELDAAAILRADGYRVVVSRTRDSSVARLTARDLDGRLLSAAGVHTDVAARDVCANEAHADVLVGIYFDAGAPNNAGSITAYDAVRPFAARSRRLASLVQRDVLRAMNRRGWKIPSAGVQRDHLLGSVVNVRRADSYGHLLLLGPGKRGYFSTPSQMPGALIEPLYITDPFEGSIADSGTGQHVIAGGIAQAVEQYFAPPPRKTRAPAHAHRG